MGFTEVADRVWVARYAWFDVNITLVGGDRGLLVVDTHSSGLAAREVVDDVRRLGVGEVVGIVNTHERFDHTFGNDTFRGSYGALPIYAHEVAAEQTVAAGERIKRAYAEDPDDPHRDEVLETVVVPADRTFSSALALDLGDRFVELVHPGRGHTAGDLVVRVPDSDVLLAGDLLRGVRTAVVRRGQLADGLAADPRRGVGTVDRTVVVPGHGAVVDRDFLEEQRNTIGIVAETIRDLATRGVPVDEALAAGEWPWPREGLATAVRRGYEQLPRSQKRLPLV